MSILINGMEMPKNCFECPWRCKVDPENLLCRISGEYFEETFSSTIQNRHKSCPLVEIPPHGRLIDADALMARFEKEEKAADEHGRDFSFSFKSAGENCAEWWSVQQMLFDAPTIIPAEEGEK